MIRGSESEQSHPTLRLGVSACLMGSAVRFDGGHSRDKLLLGPVSAFAKYVPVCPEVEIGLGTPRPTIRLQRIRESVQLMRPHDGANLTAKMREWAERRVDQIEEMDLSGYVLKKDSPTCGMERVRVYDENGSPSRDGRGIFAEVLMRRMPLLPVEEDGRLHDSRLRENFFERAFAYDRLRKFFASDWSAGSLIRFHSHEKLLLMSHNPQAYAELGRMVATVTQRDRVEFTMAYQQGFMDALRSKASVGRQVNVLQHIAGYLGRNIDKGEKAEIVTLLEDFRQGMVPLAVPMALLRHHVRRLDIYYIENQSYLNPHPKELGLRSYF